MAFHNVPPNGFPDLPDVEELEAVVKDVADLKTSKSAKADIAPDFSAESAYSAGDLVYHNGELYKFTADHAAGAWSAEDTEQATISGELDNLKSSKAAKADIAADFSVETEYEVGDLVYYNGAPYRCTNSHEGEWDADDFAATTIDGELASLRSGLTNLVINQPTSVTFDADGTGTFNAPTGYTPIMAYIDENWKADIYYMNGTWIIRARAWNDPTSLIKSTTQAFGIIFVKV